MKKLSVYALVTGCIILLIIGAKSLKNNLMDNEEQETLMPVVFSHLAKYPEMEVQDVYKLVFQACFGPGHFIINESHAHQWLDNEISQMDRNLNYSEDCFESLGGAYVRANLIPLVNNKVDMDSICVAFVNSANDSIYKEEFFSTWKIIKNASAKKSWNGPALKEIEKLLEYAEFNDWPAFHHSDKYRKLYNPHYRILKISEARKLDKDFNLGYFTE